MCIQPFQCVPVSRIYLPAPRQPYIWPSVSIFIMFQKDVFWEIFTFLRYALHYIQRLWQLEHSDQKADEHRKAHRVLGHRPWSWRAPPKIEVMCAITILKAADRLLWKFEVSAMLDSNYDKFNAKSLASFTIRITTKLFGELWCNISKQPMSICLEHHFAICFTCRGHGVHHVKHVSVRYFNMCTNADWKTAKVNCT